jgi:hypothetical protein
MSGQTQPLIQRAGKYTPARPAPAATGFDPGTMKGVHLFLPKEKERMSWGEWFWKELRWGGCLQEYLQREKATTDKRLRAVARRTDGFKQNNKSDCRVVAHIPAREFFRWRAVDPDFFNENSNLRSLRRDNPDARVYL